MPHSEKYDIKPYEPEDDDEYRTPAERAAREPGAKAGAARPGGASLAALSCPEQTPLPISHVCLALMGAQEGFPAPDSTHSHLGCLQVMGLQFLEGALL